MYDHLGIMVEEKQAKLSDLVFFTNGNYPSHVGFYLGTLNRNRYIIHSPGRAGHHIIISKFDSPLAYKSLTISTPLSSRWQQKSI